jgi:hypothetical protein
MKKIFPLVLLLLILLFSHSWAATYTVNASSDDAMQTGTTVTLTDTLIGNDLDATTEWVGMRWTNVAIPKSAKIISAVISVVPTSNTQDEPLVTVFFEDADNCATFSTGASNISNRSRTTGVTWDNSNLGANGSTYFDTPSLVSDLQTVVNRAGWASGNAICAIIQGGATSTRDLTIEAYDLGPGTNPPRLVVTYASCNGGLLALGAGPGC